MGKLLLSNLLSMKIYTKKGDKGKTSLCEGGEIAKNSDLIKAIGEVDELNSFVGLAYCGVSGRVSGASSEGGEILERIQKDLYRIGAELASGKVKVVGLEDVTWLEEMIDKFSEGREISEFVRPGEKGEFSARLHVCRSVCRRAERSVCCCSAVPEEILRYLNRLSDLFFAMGEC